MAAGFDPGAAASTPVEPTTSAVLAAARADIHNAVSCADDPHRHRQYALSARDNSAAVLLAPDASADERRHARYYLDNADAIIAESTTAVEREPNSRNQTSTP